MTTCHSSSVNLDITRFTQLLKKDRKTALSVKPHIKKTGEKKKNPSQVLTVSPGDNKRRKEFEEPPAPVPSTKEEMIAILNRWVADGAISSQKFERKKLKKKREAQNTATLTDVLNSPQQIVGTFKEDFMQRFKMEPWISHKLNKRFTPIHSSSTKAVQAM